MTTGKVVATPRFDRATLAYVLIGLGCAALLFSIRLLFTESSVPERQLLASLGVILLALGMRRPS